MADYSGDSTVPSEVACKGEPAWPSSQCLHQLRSAPVSAHHTAQAASLGPWCGAACPECGVVVPLEQWAAPPGHRLASALQTIPPTPGCCLSSL